MTIAEPTALQMIAAAETSVKGQADKTADFIRGSDYEALSGPNAILWVRQARRDTDLFNATKLHTSQDDDLTRLVKKRYKIDRFLDAAGIGTATLRRPSGGTAGTVWKGTRIAIIGSQPRFFRVTADKPVSDVNATQVIVNIESLDIGPGFSAMATANLRLTDLLWDPTWTATSLACAEGSAYETDSELIDRVRTTRRDQRVGQSTAIRNACLAAGAGQVVAFRSDFGGDATDVGLNVVYVGNSGYVGSPELVRACAIALRKVRVLGDCMQVLPMARVDIPIVVDAYLIGPPATFDLARLEVIHTAAIRQYLGGASGSFTFSRTGIAGAVGRHTVEVQRVSVASPASDVGIQTNGNFPAVLNRYTPTTIALRYHGP